MQNAGGAVHGEFEIGDAARAEKELHAARLVDRAVTQQPQVALENVSIFTKDFVEVRRSGFFFAFKKDFEVDAEGHVGGVQRVKRGKQCLDGSLVVAGGARI